jgi:hypothetical protein
VQRRRREYQPLDGAWRLTVAYRRYSQDFIADEAAAHGAKRVMTTLRSAIAVVR